MKAKQNPIKEGMKLNTKNIQMHNTYNSLKFRMVASHKFKCHMIVINITHYIA